MTKFIRLTDEHCISYLIETTGIVIETHDFNGQYSIRVNTDCYSRDRKYESKEKRDEAFSKLINQINSDKPTNVFHL